jgi:hypothetical protein
MKVLFCVVCADYGEHPMLARGIKETWGFDNTDVWYLWSSDHQSMQRQDWRGHEPEGYGTMTNKFLDFMKEYMGEYDYVMKTNTGCYIDIPALHAFLEGKPKTDFYCGYIGNFTDDHDNVDYVSGSGIIFSPDLIKKMLVYRRDFRKEHIDDVAYGLFMQLHQVKPTLGQRTSDIDDVSYHYRLRSDDGTRGLDVQNMRILHARRTVL